jgi:GMP synthase (glutamine-hydrolysing)
MPRVLVIDAVEYPPDEVDRNLGGPAGWFGGAMASVDGVEVRTVGSSDPRLAAEAAAADALVLSGSPRDAWSDDPAVVGFVRFVEEQISAGRPVFGVCYGHQVMARAAGGRVGPNPAGWEVGNAAVELTEAGRACPLFQGIEPSFEVIESHQDAVLDPPAGTTVLARNAHTAVQALAYGPRQFSVQFHPEFTPDILRVLWCERRDSLRDSLPFDIDDALDSVRPTPRLPGLFHRFVHLIPPR